MRPIFQKEALKVFFNHALHLSVHHMVTPTHNGQMAQLGGLDNHGVYH